MKRVIITLALVLAFSAGLIAAPSTKTFTYKTVGDRKLDLYVSYPPDWKASDARPAIIFFFGGGWTSGTVEQFRPQAEYFASRGLVTARADYRVKSRDNVTPDKCVEDARSAFRWMRSHASELGVDPKKIIAAGGSAGGHLAACMIIKDSVEAKGDDTSISTMPAAMLLYNPVLSFEDNMMTSRLGDKKDLANKISPTAHMTKNTPPAIIFFGTADRLKVFGDAYWAKAEKLGVRADKFLAEGQGHGFFNRSPWTERTTVAADKFLASLGYLSGPPTLKLDNLPAAATQQPAAARRQGAVAGVILRRWKTMDKNSDNFISRDEATGRLKEAFSRLDRNSDNLLDEGELRAAAQEMLARRRPNAGSRTAAVHPDTTNWPELFKPDLSNAIFPKGVWTCTDGVLTASEDQAIWTDRDYDNFILDLEFKTADGTNSGVIVHCSDIKDWIPNSVEIQIADDFSEEWSKADKTWHCAAIFGRLAPTESRVKKPGQWNHYTITCVGRKIDVALNGALVTSMDMSRWTDPKKNPDGTDIPAWLSKPLAGLPTKGRIGLQGKHAGAPIWFRNIRIKELPSNTR